MTKAFTFLSLTLLFTGCAASLPPIQGCEELGDIQPTCNMLTPEDIAASPDGRHLLLAHFGHMGEAPGSISLFDTQSGTMRPLYPTDTDSEPAAEGDHWGQSNCSLPPFDSIGPHGTHLHQLQDGRWRYLVVNHGQREAVELFEFIPQGSDSKLIWRGCVVAAENTQMNDVVGLNNGDLVYTRMLKPNDSLSLIKSALGIATGELWRWNSKSGLEPLPETRAAMPNGLEIDAANEFVYADMYMQGQVWQVRLADGKVTARYDIPNADNSAWGTDGRLWIASHDMGMRDMLNCFDKQDSPCPGAFNIIALDPSTGETEILFRHQGAPMGAATVAVPQAGRVYMGSFAGDRMISVADFGKATAPTNHH